MVHGISERTRFFNARVHVGSWKNRAMAHDLPESITEEILQFPESSMGAHRVKVAPQDGREYSDVYVAWGKNVVRVGTSEFVPFDPAHVVAAAYLAN
jgi:hypothetical protein